MSTERKWKRGDIGPDGRVFWIYNQRCKNGERWVTLEKLAELREKNNEHQRKLHASNTEKAREKCRKWRSANAKKIKEIRRKLRADNPEKFRDLGRKYYAAKIEKERERNRKNYAANAEKKREQSQKSKTKRRNQAAADQFFIMAGAVESISQLK